MARMDPAPTTNTTTATSTTRMTTSIATPDRAEALAALISLAYRVEDFLVDGDRTNPQEVRDKMTHGAFLTISDASESGSEAASEAGAEASTGALVGSVYVEIRDGDGKANGSGRGEKRGYFGMLAVHPAHQGKGLARRLIGAAEDHARAAGCAYMDISVLSPRTELPAFYRHLGYTETGTRPFDETTKVPCHIIAMAKKL